MRKLHFWKRRMILLSGIFLLKHHPGSEKYQDHVLSDI
jgi:hypothetical protein